MKNLFRSFSWKIMFMWFVCIILNFQVIIIYFVIFFYIFANEKQALNFPKNSLELLKSKLLENGFVRCALSEKIWFSIPVSSPSPLHCNVVFSWFIFVGRAMCRQGWQQGNNRRGNSRCRAGPSSRGRLYRHQGHRQWQLRRSIPSQTLRLGRDGRHQKGSPG